MFFLRNYHPLSASMLRATLLCLSVGSMDAGHPDFERHGKMRVKALNNLKAVENEVRTWTYCGKELRGKK
jgi:hypothetical protein